MRINLTGQRFNRLKVLGPDEVFNGKQYWFCLCECGTKIVATTGHLRGGGVQSCGCLMKENSARTGKENKTHGMRHTTEYESWLCMRRRCNDPNNNRYGAYGFVGIKVCDEWNDSFEQFIADMGMKPTPRHTINRKDPDLGYFKENCEWATYSEQALNARYDGTFSNNMYLYEQHRRRLLTKKGNQ